MHHSSRGRRCQLGLLLVIALQLCPLSHTSRPVEPCPELQTQRGLDLEQVSGTWYVVELVHHNASVDARGPQRTTPRGNLECAVLNIHIANDTTVELKWSQQPPFPTLEYTFEIENETMPGVWVARASPWRWPHGTPAEEIHVMKAVADHAVLTFCQPGAGGHVFTVIIGRHNSLQEKLVHRVVQMLEWRGLVTHGVQKMKDDVCYKNKAWTLGSVASSATTPNSSNGSRSGLIRVLGVALNTVLFTTSVLLM
ncbi:hypothetical protein B566_EDAN012311 [Ephemera danica]|nr:hypothetical protein B566_EDAN012311 [Ephemera danica]